jgi:hypothetical protein
MQPIQTVHQAHHYQGWFQHPEALPSPSADLLRFSMESLRRLRLPSPEQNPADEESFALSFTPGGRAEWKHWSKRGHSFPVAPNSAISKVSKFIKDHGDAAFSFILGWRCMNEKIPRRRWSMVESPWPWAKYVASQKKSDLEVLDATPLCSTDWTRSSINAELPFLPEARPMNMCFTPTPSNRGSRLISSGPHTWLHECHLFPPTTPLKLFFFLMTSGFFQPRFTYDGFLSRF